MVQAFRCSQCSAPVQDDNWTSCPFCGTVLNKPTINPLKAVTAPARFEAARRSPEYQDCMQFTPSTSKHSTGTVILILFAALWVGISLFMTAAFSQAPGAMMLFPLGMGIFGAVFLSKGIGKQLAIGRAPWERELVVVIDERTSVTGGGKNRSATTNYFVNLQREGSERSEFPCVEEVASSAAPGDIGIAYIKGGHVFGFRRLDA